MYECQNTVFMNVKTLYGPYLRNGWSNWLETKQGKSEGFDSCNCPYDLAQIWSKLSMFQPLWPKNVIISNSSVNSNQSYHPETLNLGKNWRFLVPCDMEILWMTLENNRAPLLYYIKLCAPFQSHGWIQTGVTVRKHSIQVKISDFLSCITLKFDGWPWKTIGHLFYAIWSFVHHFVAIGEFKLELQSGMPNLGQTQRFFKPCDLEIWRMMLKNNRAPLLSNIKLCASFHHYMWIQTGNVTVRKWLSWVLTSVTLTFRMGVTKMSWWYNDGNMVKRCDGQNHSYSCLVTAKKCI